MFSEAVRGLAAIMLDGDPPPGGERVSIDVSGVDHAVLLAAVLEEALFGFEVHGRLAVGAEVKVSADRVWGSLLVTREAVARGPQVKAVTYHRLAVEHDAGGWRATVYLDV